MIRLFLQWDYEGRRSSIYWQGKIASFVKGT